MTIKINGTNTTAQPSITGTDTDTGLVYGTDEVKIVTGGTDRVTVDSSGNLGISTSSPTSPLEVHSGSGTNIIAKSTNGNGGFLNYSGLASNGTTTFSVNHNGTIYTAGGLNFGSVTSPVTSQTLDDYEEGTWTPTASLGTCNVVRAVYVKIGNFVKVAAVLNSFSEATSTISVSIEGLPFTDGVSDGTAAGSAMSKGCARVTPIVYLTSDRLQFYGNSTANSWIELRYSDLDAGHVIYLQASWRI